MLNYDLRERCISKYENGDHLKIRLMTRSNMKLDKSKKVGYLTKGLSLSPNTLVSKKTLCPFSDESCRASCINTSGQGALYFLRKNGDHIIHESRGLKTIWFERDREGFLNQLRKEIKNFIILADKKGMIPVIRLNIFSDILWERIGIPQEFSDVTFYDYTRIPNRIVPPNYHLTFSRGATNQNDVKRAIKQGYNISIVFSGELPIEYMGLPVINADETDLRFLDNKEYPQVIAGLKAKGQGKKDTSGFVVDSEMLTSKVIRIAA